MVLDDDGVGKDAVSLPLDPASGVGLVLLLLLVEERQRSLSPTSPTGLLNHISLVCLHLTSTKQGIIYLAPARVFESVQLSAKTFVRGQGHCHRLGTTHQGHCRTYQTRLF